MTFYILILTFIPFFSVPYIVLHTIMSIWFGLIKYKKSEKDYLKWDIQKIILTTITIFFTYKTATTVYNDSWIVQISTSFIYTKKFLIYPSLLLIYLFLMAIIILRKKKLNSRSQKHIKFSLFILASLFYSIWWVYFSILYIPISQLGEGLGG